MIKKYFARLENNIVIDVTIAETKKWVEENFEGEWIETYSNKPNKPMAAIGFEYISNLDIFREVKPFESWILSDNQLFWIAPVPMPQDGEIYVWNEEIGDWEEVRE
jgi:hypothetical protein